MKTMLKAIQLTPTAIDEYDLTGKLGATLEELLALIRFDAGINSVRYIFLDDHDHSKCCRYLLCAHPMCCGHYGNPEQPKQDIVYVGDQCMGSWSDINHWVHPRCTVMGIPHEPHEIEEK